MLIYRDQLNNWWRKSLSYSYWKWYGL